MSNYLMGLQPRTGYTGKLYDKWIGFILEALSCYDIERNIWVHLPESGGYYDQDDFLMSIWEYIRISFRKMRHDEAVISWVQTKQQVAAKQKAGKK